MIAVIERAFQVVWGVGETSALAMQDAQKQIAAWKKARAQKQMPAIVGTLEYAALSPDANTAQDGEGLWEWVILPEAAPVQDGLF